MIHNQLFHGAVFISCDPDEGKDLADWISQKMTSGSPPLPSIVSNGREDVTAAIQTCSCFVLVATAAATCPGSKAQNECKQALKYKKPIVIASRDSVVLPSRLARRPQITVAKSNPGTYQALRDVVLGTASIQGLLSTASQYRSDAEEARDYLDIEGEALSRLENEIDELNRTIASLSAALEDPEGVRDRLNRRIELGVERERVPVEPSRPAILMPFVFNPPFAAPDYFEDRNFETEQLAQFLKGQAAKVMVIVGKGGIGKTSIVCRALQHLQSGQLPDNLGRFEVSGIVYLSFITTRTPSLEHIVEGLLQILPETDRKRLSSLLASQELTRAAKIRGILSEFSNERFSGPVIVLMDNMEDGIDSVTHNIEDLEVTKFLEELVASVGCQIKVVMTSRINPANLQSNSPRVQFNLPLDEGLPSPYAENVLRALSPRLRHADNSELEDLRKLTRGYPRAMEAVGQILNDYDTIIEDLLNAEFSDKTFVDALVGEAFSRLHYGDQLVMQALAVFNEPVPATAIEYVLRPWESHLDADGSFRRLSNMRFVRREGAYFYLHPVDRQHALEVLDQTTFSTGNDVLEMSWRSMKTKVAEYYQQIQVPRHEWKHLDDIKKWIKQFEIEIELGNEHEAAEIVEDISDFQHEKGGFAKNLKLTQSLIAVAESKSVKKMAYKNMARANWRVGKVHEAVQAQKQYIDLIDGDDSYEAICARVNIYIYDKAQASLEDGLRAFEDLYELLQERYTWNHGDAQTALQQIGWYKRDLGYLEENVKKQRAALDAARRTGNKDNIEGQTHNYAEALNGVGKTSKALGLFEEALSLADETRNPLWRGNHLARIASIKWDMNHKEEALKISDDVAKIRIEIGNLGGQAENCLQRARWLLLDGELESAEQNVTEAQQIFSEISKQEYGSGLLLAKIRAAQGNWTEAERLANDALRINKEEGTSERRILLAISALHQENHQTARSEFKKALEEAKERLSRSSRSVGALVNIAYSSLGLAMLGEDTLQDAITSFNRARGLVSLPGRIQERHQWFGLLAGCCEAIDTVSVLEAIDGVKRTRDLKPSPEEPVVEVSHNDKMGLVRMLARLAFIHPAGPGTFFQNLVRQSNLPQNTQMEISRSFGDDPESGAMDLFERLYLRGINPNDKNNYLGSVLYELLPKLSVDDAATTAALITKYQLLRSDQQKSEIEIRYQVPSTVPLPNQASSVGPEFSWDGPTDEVTLQGWLRPSPEYLDVSFLREAISRSRSVCLVEVGATGETGTGVLVGPDLVLTNHHVLARNSDLLNQNAQTTTLRFGAYTSEAAQNKNGQVAKLFDEKPVVGYSPVDEFDFVLLRASHDIESFCDLVPATLGQGIPVKNSAMHILQHPNGGSMKLSISDNGVTSANHENGKIQYITRTSGGSSGSPCFDENWNVVAIHRAEISKSFGSIREGVLLSSIYPRIKKFLA